MKPTTSKYIEVRRSKIHGTGVYAARSIPKDETIIEYVGKKISKKESDDIYEKQLSRHKTNPEEDGSVYTFELNSKWDIDGNVSWNTARFINHSCSPNAEAVNTTRRILIQATRNIKKGEEITYNYGYNIDDYHEHPCRCGSHNCIGYIADESHWKELKKKIRKEKKSGKKGFLAKFF